jgi:sulfate transport system substrate-binding protein
VKLTRSAHLGVEIAAIRNPSNRDFYRSRPVPKKSILVVIALLAVVAVVVVPKLSTQSPSANSGTNGAAGPAIELLNVSYDPTRELWEEINNKFIPIYEKEHGGSLTIRQSHGGSSTQARSVVDGMAADVVTLALWSDTNLLQTRGLLRAGWDEQFPNRSLPYVSTIVFVVRKGNPRGIKDWPDLVKPGVVIVTPNPKTSGNGKLSFLAAWGSVLHRGGSDAEAKKFVAELYKHTEKLDIGARGATSTFAKKGMGDVHLTWENEAHLEVRESNGELELINPPVSIRAEPHVAVVDGNVDRKGTRVAAEAYLNYLYTDEAQEIIASHFYRPTNEAVLARHSSTFQPIELFTVTKVAENWDAAQGKYFSDGAIFDSFYEAGAAQGSP